MTTEIAEYTPLHDLRWTRSKRGYAVFTRWKGLHVSMYQRPNEDGYRFRIDGPFPASVTSTTAAIGFLWRWVLSRIGRGHDPVVVSPP